jgi:hypothetical protein
MIQSKRALVYWACQVVGWGACFLINTFFAALSLPPVVMHRVALVYGCASVIAILCTHAYRFYIRRRGWAALPPLRVLPRAVAGSLVVGFVVGYLAIGLWLSIIHGPYHVPGPGWTWTISIALIWCFFVFVWSFLYLGFHFFERSREAEVKALQLQVTAKEAQLQGLVSQINPHFMFNCLNSLRALIAEDPIRAKAMVTELSSLLRYSLQSGKSATVPLETEMETVKTYLQLEAIRFEERLSVEFDVRPETLRSCVPCMLLQSLVENGVKHGIEKRPHGGRIQIRSWLSDGMLNIRVVNSGQLSEKTVSTRIGLANAQERLRLLYGEAASLKLGNCGPDSVLAEISLPAEEKGR